MERPVASALAHAVHSTSTAMMPRPTSRSRERLELAAILLTAVLACAGGVAWIHRTVREAQRNGTRSNLVSVCKALGEFHRKMGRFPRTEEGLQALIDQQLLDSLPEDYWGGRIEYRLEQAVAVVSSRGLDRAPGGEGDARDVSVRRGPSPAAPCEGP